MRALLPLIVLGSLAGCTNAEGNWEGSCTFSGYTIPAVLDIASDKGGDLSGDLTVTSSGATVVFSGTGTRDGVNVNMDLSYTLSGYSLPTTFDGQIDGDTMFGTWSYRQSGYDMALICDLSRR